MSSIGKDKIVNMGGGMNYINADCLGACNGNPETNLFDITKYTLAQCEDIGEGNIKSNIVNNYYCRASTNKINSQILSSLGKTITFSINEAIPNRIMSIVISGTRTGGASYQEMSTSIGGFNSISGIIADDFTSIASIELRWNRYSAPYTDTTTIVSGLKLTIEGV